jgi:hypothetical protein
MILVRKRSAEESHETVAEELIERPLVAVDLGKRAREEAIQERMHRFWPQAFGERSGVDDVAEQDSYLLALARDGVSGRKDLLGQMRGCVRRRSPLELRRVTVHTSSPFAVRTSP